MFAPGWLPAIAAAAFAYSSSIECRSSACSRLVPVAGCALTEPADLRRGEQRRDVVGFERPPLRHFAALHQRRPDGKRQIGVRAAPEPWPRGDVQALQDARGQRILCGDEAGRLQVLAEKGTQVLQVVPAEQRARAVAVGQGVGAHHVGQIGVRVWWILALADARDLAEPRCARCCRAA